MPSRFDAPRLPAVAGLFLLLAHVAGCDADAAPPAAGEPPKAAANTAAGRVLGQDGKAITATGVKCTVSINGISSAGEKIVYTPAVAADGSWKAELVAGTYKRPRASLKAPFEERVFEYELVPSAAEGDFKGADGLVCDFTWKVRDPKPHHEENADPGNWTHYFGGMLGVTFDRFPEGKPQIANLGPKGTKLRFTATPAGKLIDGSDGKPLTFELEYDHLFRQVKPKALHDLPVARYKVAAVVIAPDGAEAPLVVRRQEEKEFHDSIEVTFVGYAGGAEPIGETVFFTLKP
jgi:hypothetical protein